MNYRVSILSLLLLSLSACGFSSIYGQRSVYYDTVQAYFNQTFIQTIADAEGQYLYNALIDRINSQGMPHFPIYEVDIERLNETEIDLDITKNDNVTRAQLRLSLVLMLKDRKTNKVLLKKDLHSLTSYNILNSEFATRVSRKAARENVLNNLAQQIETQLALYFRRLPAQEPETIIIE